MVVDTKEKLEQEPSGDCISKQAVIELMRSLTRWCVRSEDGKFNNIGLLYDDVMFGIEQLPSVTPKGVTITDFADKCRECGKQKKGKWIYVHHLENKITYDSWKCSECQHDFSSEEESTVDFDEYKYCPNCGAKMIESEK